MLQIQAMIWNFDSTFNENNVPLYLLRYDHVIYLSYSYTNINFFYMIFYFENFSTFLIFFSHFLFIIFCVLK